MQLHGWKRRALQNAIDRDRPVASLLRWPAWMLACVVGRPTTMSFRTGGLRMQLVPKLSGFGSTSLYIKRDAYEPELLLIQRFVKPGDVVIDIGASFGVFSLFLAHWVGPAGQVYAFEPGRFSFDQLRANVAMNPVGERIVLHNLAAAERREQLNLYHIGDAPVTFSLGGDGGAAESISADRVDAIVPADLAPRISFIKIDVEGFERFALEGCRAILEKAKPTIMFEVSAGALARSGMTPDEMYGYLRSYGYAFRYFDEEGALVPATDGQEGNIIALIA